MGFQTKIVKAVIVAQLFAGTGFAYAGSKFFNRNHKSEQLQQNEAWKEVLEGLKKAKSDLSVKSIKDISISLADLRVDLTVAGKDGDALKLLDLAVAYIARYLGGEIAGSPQEIIEAGILAADNQNLALIKGKFEKPLITENVVKEKQADKEAKEKELQKLEEQKKEEAKKELELQKQKEAEELKVSETTQAGNLQAAVDALTKEYNSKNGTFSSMEELLDFVKRLDAAMVKVVKFNEASETFSVEINDENYAKMFEQLKSEEKRLSKLKETVVPEKKEEKVIAPEVKEELKVEKKVELKLEKKEEIAPKKDEEQLKVEKKEETVPKIEEKKEAPKQEEELKVQPEKKEAIETPKKEIKIEEKKERDDEELKVRKTKPVKKEDAPQNNIEKEAPKEEKKGDAPEEEKNGNEFLKIRPVGADVRIFDEVYGEFYNVISGVDLTSGSTEQFIEQARELIRACEKLIEKGEKKEPELERLKKTLGELEAANKR